MRLPKSWPKRSSRPVCKSRPRFLPSPATSEAAIARAPSIRLSSMRSTPPNAGNWNVLGIATASGDAYLRWGLYTHESSGNILDMAGKRLAWSHPVAKTPRISATSSCTASSRRRFSSFAPRPRTSPPPSAKSFCAAPTACLPPSPPSAASRCAKVYDAGEVGRIPNPVLVQVSPRVTDAIAATVRKAAGSFNTTGVLDGFRTTAQAGEAIRSVRVRLRGRPERSLVLAEPSRLNTQVASTMVSAPELPPAKSPTHPYPPAKGFRSVRA